MKKILAFLLLLAPFASAQVVVNPGGGGSATSSGSTISGCTSSILYADASSLLKCDPAAVVNGSVSTAGRSILTIQDTISGSSATSNFLNITGTFPATLSTTTTGVNIALTGDDDNSAQNGLQVSLSSSGANPQNRITINSLLTGTFINSDALAVYGKNTATSAGNGFTVGARGEASGNAAGRWAGIMGYATSGNGNATATIGGYFAGVGTTSATTTSNYGVVSGAQSSGTNGIGGLFFLNATSNFDVAATAPSTLITATGKAALVADNGSVAANIFEARDNGTAVLTVADGGAITHTGPSLNTTTLGVSGGIVGTGLADNSYGLWLGTNNNANSVIFTAPSLTPDPGYLGSGTTSNSWHIGESQDRTFDFNNGSCGTSTCTDPGLIIHSAVQDTTQYNHLANWGQAGGAIKTLTESAATSVVRIPVAALEGTGGKLTYRVKAADATDVQIREGEIRFAIVNKAGTETCTLSGASEAADGSVVAASVGTLTYGITCDTTPANAVDIQFNAVSSLTQTTLNIQYFVTLTGVGQPARQ